MYTGRFAPSPSGLLHFGSLVAALASWLDARAANGRWLVRIEDLDTPRSSPAVATAILRQLEAFGLEWDGPVVYQSARVDKYKAALETLQRSGNAYWCACTRREIADSTNRPGEVSASRVYPGTCRSGLRPGATPRAMRVRTHDHPIRFTDRMAGSVEQIVAREVGDFVVLRADGVFAYQLAVVVDDAEQGVTDVVRGADLLDSTARQILLQQLLGLATPRYLHVPIAVSESGAKLSKQNGAQPLPEEQRVQALRDALDFLGLGDAPAAHPGDVLAWARARWKARLAAATTTRFAVSAPPRYYT